jgi:hypothetical protein
MVNYYEVMMTHSKAQTEVRWTAGFRAYDVTAEISFSVEIP